MPFVLNHSRLFRPFSLITSRVIFDKKVNWFIYLSRGKVELEIIIEGAKWTKLPVSMTLEFVTWYYRGLKDLRVTFTDVYRVSGADIRFLERQKDQTLQTRCTTDLELLPNDDPGLKMVQKFITFRKTFVLLFFARLESGVNCRGCKRLLSIEVKRCKKLLIPNNHLTLTDNCKWNKRQDRTA